MRIGISFSLFGSSDHYLSGLKQNFAVMQDIYPDSTMIVHTDQPERVAAALPEVEIETHPHSKDLTGAFWRFLSYNDPRFDAVLFRDADSVVNVREAAAVNEWLISGLPIHTMLDHEHHITSQWPVMAGMWAARKGGIPFDFNYLVKWWMSKKDSFQYTSDQWFLRRYIWPLIASGDGLLHCRDTRSRWCGEPWPPHVEYNGHVGERISQALT
jgi:hypothetical protein